MLIKRDKRSHALAQQVHREWKKSLRTCAGRAALHKNPGRIGSLSGVNFQKEPLWPKLKVPLTWLLSISLLLAATALLQSRLH